MKRNSIALAATLSILAPMVAWAADDARLQAGKKTYEYWCKTCHGTERGLPGFEELPGRFVH